MAERSVWTRTLTQLVAVGRRAWRAVPTATVRCSSTRRESAGGDDEAEDALLATHCPRCRAELLAGRRPSLKRGEIVSQVPPSRHHEFLDARVVVPGT